MQDERSRMLRQLLVAGMECEAWSNSQEMRFKYNAMKLCSNADG